MLLNFLLTCKKSAKNENILFGKLSDFFQKTSTNNPISEIQITPLQVQQMKASKNRGKENRKNVAATFSTSQESLELTAQITCCASNNKWHNGAEIFLNSLLSYIFKNIATNLLQKL